MKYLKFVEEYQSRYGMFFFTDSELNHIAKMTESIVDSPEMAGSFCSAVAKRDWETAAAKADTTNAKALYYYFYLMANKHRLNG